MVASLLSSKETVLFAGGVDTIPSPANERSIAARAKEKPSMFDIAVLPLLILADAAPFSFILFRIMFVGLQLNEGPEWIG